MLAWTLPLAAGVRGRDAAFVRLTGWAAAAVSIALVVLLPLGAASFVVPGALLALLMVVSLPVLLLWAGAIAYQVGRHSLR